MLAAGVGPAIDQGIRAVKVGPHLVACLCRPGIRFAATGAAVGRDDSHALAVLGIAADRRVDKGFRRLDVTVNQGYVALGDGAVLELPLHGPEGLVVFGGNDQAGRVFVQPVNNARPPFAADSGQIRTVCQIMR